MRKLILGLIFAGLLLAATAVPAFADHPPSPVPGGTMMVLDLVSPPPGPPNPISSRWHELRPNPSHMWHLTSWKDHDGSGGLSKGDWVDFRRINPKSGKDFGPRNWATVTECGAECAGFARGSMITWTVEEDNPRPPGDGDGDGSVVNPAG